MITPLFGHKHARKHPILLFVLGAVGVVSMVPTPVLAFSSSLLMSAPAFMNDIMPETLDISLPEAPTPVPIVNPHDLAVTAPASPITEKGNWPKAESVAPVVRTAVAKKVKPTLEAPIVLEGEASYYSWAGCLGCNPLRVMANGQQLNDNALTMAIGADKKHLVGYQARVTNLVTGKSVTVHITDTGGFYQAKYGNRVADLTIATKEAIGMKGGLGQVRVEIF